MKTILKMSTYFKVKNTFNYMKYLNKFGKNPQRGTSKSVGIDFFMPDASSWTKEQTNAFLSYLADTNQYHYVNEVSELTPENLNKILLYISLDSSHKGDFITWVENNKEVLHVNPQDSVCVPSGIHTLFKPGYCGIFFNKSGMGRKGWSVKAQVIDEDYTGCVHLNMVNTTDGVLSIVPGQKLTQLIELPALYDTPEEINEDEYFGRMSSSERGDGGFGSTGEK